MKKYIVLMEATHGDPTWDTFCGEFNTPEEASSAAFDSWRYLTDREKSGRKILVCAVESSSEDSDVFDDIVISGYEIIKEYSTFTH